ncbi:MAG: 2-octaprenyl-6-methoxyphenyl hydroxylase [Xanthomonadales bacterium]|nr:2-octaprenyl-6-methoxyphenyl hydroxylase [Xanthomonadales bacterium]
MQEPELARFDVVIVGGGLVGCSLAIALSGSGWSIGLIEQHSPELAPPGFDDRNLALSRASLLALQRLQVLPLLDTPPESINAIHVSRAGEPGNVHLSAAEHPVDRFGGVVVARELGHALRRRVQQCTDVAVWSPAKVCSASAGMEDVRLQVQRPQGAFTVEARLLLAADGSDSPLRQAMGIDETVHDYAQHLFVSVLQASRAHQQCAWERFTEHGPVALLPMAHDRFGSVMAVASTDAEAVTALSDDAYLALFQQRFGWRAGRFTRVGKRSAYAMRLRVAKQLVAPRFALLGNAAQTLHPIGAQGFNLGLRDALWMAQLLGEQHARQAQADPGDAGMLQRYVAARVEDRQRTLDFSDGMARLFVRQAWPVRVLRAAGMMLLEASPLAKRRLAEQAMGLAGRLPRILQERAQ